MLFLLEARLKDAPDGFATALGASAAFRSYQQKSVRVYIPTKNGTKAAA
jgi:hypothetical protein